MTGEQAAKYAGNMEKSQLPEKLNIILIDDDAVDRQTIRRGLVGDDIEINWIEFNCFEDALDNWGQNPVDCIFIDYNLPDYNGIEGVQKIKELDPYMPIVMVTGVGNEDLAVRAMQAGARDYFNKEKFDGHSVRRALNNARAFENYQKQVDEQHRALENFSRILVHDMKEPARSIYHIAKIIREGLEDKLDSKQLEEFSYITSASERMMQLIDTVASYTFVDAKEPEHIEVDLNEVIQDVILNLNSLLADVKAEVTYDGLPSVTGERAQLVQLFQNLIGNGIKYCRQDIPKVHISASEKDGKWLVAVKDNGIGIPEAFLQKIFGVFERLHTSKEFKGTGLGLATCKKIAERHKAEIWCESEEGKGSQFFVAFSKVG